MVDVAKLAIAVDASQVRTANAELLRFRQAGTQAEISAARLSRQIANDNARSWREFSNLANATSPALGRVAAAAHALRTPMGAIAVGVGAAAAGIGALGVIAGKSVAAFAELQKEQATYNAVIRATGMAAGRTGDDIEDLATSIRKSTTATEGDVRRASAILLTFKSVSGSTFDDALRLSQDLAAVGFGNMTSAATMLGKALEDPIAGLTALRRVGVTFSESQKQQINNFIETGQVLSAQQLIVKSVKEQVGGAGAAQGDTLAGAWNQLSEAQNNWFERTGQDIERALDLRSKILGIARAIDEVNDRANFRSSPQGELEAARQALDEAKRLAVPGATPTSPLTFGAGAGRYNPRATQAMPGPLGPQITTSVVQAQMRLTAAEQAAALDELARAQAKLMASNAAFEHSEQAKRDKLSGAFNDITEAQKKFVQSAQLEINLIGKTIEEQARLRAEYELTKDVKDKSILTNEQFIESVRKLATERASLAQTQVIKSLQDEISFKEKIIHLTEEEVRIVEQLRGAYKSVGEALASDEARRLRNLDQIKAGQEALTGLFSGISREIRTSENLGKTMMDRVLSLGDRVVDKQIEGFIKANSGEGGFLAPLTKLLGGALTSTGTMTVTAGIVNVNGGIGIGGGGIGAAGFPGFPGIPGTASSGGEWVGPPGAMGGAAGLPAALAALRKIESGSFAGNYSAVNPSSGALGAYQVLPSSLRSWSPGVFGQPVSPNQFLSSPAMQDQLATKVYGGYADKYGFEGASRAWYRGEGGMNRTDVIGANSMTPQQYGAKFQTNLDQYTKSLGNVNTATTEAATGLTDVSKSATDATGGLGSFSKGLQGLFSGGGGGGGIGNLFGGGGGLFGGTGGSGAGGNWDWGFITPTNHAGGIAGAPGPGRFIHPSYFADAYRYRGGGIAGFAPDEVPIIAHRGEEVLTATDPRHRGNNSQGRGRSSTIQLILPDATPEMVSKSRGQLARTFAIAQKMAARHN